MTPVNDLMERVAGADPVRDPGSLTPDEQRDADALLQRLLAEPAPAAAPRPTRPHRRWPQLAVATAFVAVAVFAAASLLGSDDGPGPNVVARAVAALTDDDVIYHAEVIARAQAPDFPEANRNFYYETWHTASGRMRQRSYGPLRNRKKGVYGEVAGQRRQGRLGGPALTYDPLTNLIYETGFGRSRSGKGAPGFDPFDPGRSVKELQAEGRLRVAGRVEVGGRPAYRLVSGDVTSSEGSVQSSVLLVDTETYLPRELRLTDRLSNGVTRRLRWRYVLYERLPLNDKTESLLHFHPPARAKCRPGTEKLDRKGSLGFPNPCAR
jgi:hypothetical protein